MKPCMKKVCWLNSDAWKIVLNKFSRKTLAGSDTELQRKSME
jgi:hypothetical protein